MFRSPVCFYSAMGSDSRSRDDRVNAFKALNKRARIVMRHQTHRDFFIGCRTGKLNKKEWRELLSFDNKDEFLIFIKAFVHERPVSREKSGLVNLDGLNSIIIRLNLQDKSNLISVLSEGASKVNKINEIKDLFSGEGQIFCIKTDEHDNYMKVLWRCFDMQDRCASDDNKFFDVLFAKEKYEIIPFFASEVYPVHAKNVANYRSGKLMKDILIEFNQLLLIPLLRLLYVLKVPSHNLVDTIHKAVRKKEKEDGESQGEEKRKKNK